MRGASLAFILFLSLIHADPCPDGYTRSPSGEDCYQALSFYDKPSNQFAPKTFDEAEAECNQQSGGLLASIHSPEENYAVLVLDCGQPTRNIGLRCTGNDCKWDDGSQVTYTFFNGKGPEDDGITRCYGMDEYGTWIETNCGKQEGACWICKVKAKTITCADDETEYKGGCVSVHSKSPPQQYGEAACPGGGHRVSIHSSTENDFYKRLALEAGVSGTFFIGGQFIDGEFEWTDGSYQNTDQWTDPFPNTFFGNCTQMLLASEFGVAGQWTNIDCTVKQAFMCFRDSTNHEPTGPPTLPLADPICHSPLEYTDKMTNVIYSPNFPLSIPQQFCEYVVAVGGDKRVSVRFPVYDMQSGARLALYEFGTTLDEPIAIFTSDAPSPDEWFNTTARNIMFFEFYANGTTTPVGTGWQAEFIGID